MKGQTGDGSGYSAWVAGGAGKQKRKHWGSPVLSARIAMMLMFRSSLSLVSPGISPKSAGRCKHRSPRAVAGSFLWVFLFFSIPFLIAMEVF